MSNIARIISILALAVALAGIAPAQPAADFSTNSTAPSDEVLFRNGDLLNGELLAIDPQSAVRWRNPDAAEPIEFKPDSIAQIDFPEPATSAARSNTTCRLLMANGDSLEGDLLSCDRDSVAVQTWYAGRLSIARASLQSISFIPHSPAVFDGITGLEGWTQGVSSVAMPGETSHWIYRNGAFYASKAASIARDLKLPDVAEIQFDLAWKGGLNLAVALYTDSLVPILLNAKDQGPNFGGFYSLRFQYTAFIDLWPIKKSEPLRPLGQLYFPSLNSKDRLHVDLRVSKPRHRIALLLDGTLVKEWEDPEGFAGEGTGLRFVQNPSGIIKLSNLRITQWDGVMAETTAEAEDAAHDAFWPDNGAKVPGTIHSIANGIMTASTTNGPVEIPLTKLKAIEFAHLQPGQPQVQPAAVHATFAQGGTLTFVLESWRPDEMIVRSADFGRARINPVAFTRLQFLSSEKKPADGPKG